MLYTSLLQWHATYGVTLWGTPTCGDITTMCHIIRRMYGMCSGSDKHDSRAWPRQQALFQKASLVICFMTHILLTGIVYPSIYDRAA
jgi:hypothetical protein